jgi:hypothetical protein
MAIRLHHSFWPDQFEGGTSPSARTGIAGTLSSAAGDGVLHSQRRNTAWAGIAGVHSLPETRELELALGDEVLRLAVSAR